MSQSFGVLAGCAHKLLYIGALILVLVFGVLLATSTNFAVLVAPHYLVSLVYRHCPEFWATTEIWPCIASVSPVSLGAERTLPGFLWIQDIFGF